VFIRIFSWLTLYLACIAISSATELLAEGIQDNSFLVEEAYNQEPGVVQHILTVPVIFNDARKEVSPSFTQEWPIFSQQHQFSYTIPHTFLEDEHGFDDIRLNYRFQALFENEKTPAFAPRFTLVIPAGDAGEGFGHDQLGYEINLPFSKIVSDRWTLHFNAGGSLFPDVHGRDLWNYNLEASAIYAISANFNLMIESVAFWEQDVDESNRADRTLTTLLSPGARYAVNLRNDAQLVVGLAVPIGLTSDLPRYGLFFFAR
jgi:Putative MetA-pathway of phenol degradation